MRLRALLIVAAFLMFPAAAQARSVLPELPGSTEAFVLHGSHHYEIVVQLKNRRMLVVGVVKEKRSRAHSRGQGEPGTTTYEVVSHQRPGSDDIDARIGGLGRVDARFVPGRTERIKGPPGCKGPKTVAQGGHFVGRIDFRGEGGYTSARADRVWGAVVKVPQRTCHKSRPRPRPKPGSTTARLAAFAGTTDKSTNEEEGKPKIIHLVIHRPRDQVQVLALGSVSASGKPGGLKIGTFVASAERHLGAVREWGFALRLSFKGALGLRLPKPLEPTTEAVYSPPTPFSGSATFRHPAGGKPTWTGNLALELPGFGRIALTGPETHAELCEGIRCGLPGAPPTG